MSTVRENNISRNAQVRILGGDSCVAITGGHPGFRLRIRNKFLYRSVLYRNPLLKALATKYRFL